MTWITHQIESFVVNAGAKQLAAMIIVQCVKSFQVTYYAEV